MRTQRGNAAQATLWAMATFLLCLSATTAISTLSTRPSVDERTRVLTTPLVETTSVALDSKLLAALRARGVRQMAIEPIGTSTAAFNILVNGAPVAQSYSTASSLEQMYRLDLEGPAPRVWVTEAIQQGWEPRLVRFYLERELTRFLEKTREQEDLRRQWTETPEV